MVETLLLVVNLAQRIELGDAVTLNFEKRLRVKWNAMIWYTTRCWIRICADISLCDAEPPNWDGGERLESADARTVDRYVEAKPNECS